MRYDDEPTGGSGFLMGLVTGTVLGAALAVLFAPKAGREIRRDLAEGASDLGQAAKDRWADVAETAATAVDKGRAAYSETLQEAADSASKSVDKVKGAVKDAAKEVGSSAPSAKGGFTGTRY